MENCPDCKAMMDRIAKMEELIISLESKRINLTGWKGKDKIDIVKQDDVWIVTEHRKKRETDEIAQITHRIKDADVNALYQIILLLCPFIHSFTTFKDVANVLIAKNPLWGDMDSNALFGNRTKYFRYFYYPCKILQSLARIKYSSNGQIERL